MNNLTSISNSPLKIDIRASIENESVPEGIIVQPSNMTFDFSANKVVNFHCKLSLQNEDLSGNVTEVGPERWRLWNRLYSRQ